MINYLSLRSRILKTAGLMIIGFVVAGCAPEPEVKDVQATEAEIEYLFSRWNNALQTGDAAAVAAYYANDAVLLPLTSNSIHNDHDEIRDYFSQFLIWQPNSEIEEQHITINGNIAINAGIYTLNLAKNGNVKQIQARYSFVYERQNDGEWLIINHHTSAMPGLIAETPQLLEDIVSKG